MTPYPGTGLYQRMHAAGRMLHDDWDRYDTRQVVFEPRGMTAAQLEAGYRRAYRDFYRWGALWRGGAAPAPPPGRAGDPPPARAGRRRWAPVGGPRRNRTRLLPPA